MQRITYDTYATTVGKIIEDFLVVGDIENIVAGTDFLVITTKDAKGKGVEYRLDRTELAEHFGLHGEIVSMNVKLPGEIVGKDVVVKNFDIATLVTSVVGTVKLSDTVVEFIYTVTETL